MSAGSDEIQLVVLEFVKQDPVTLYMAVGVVFPLAAQRVVFLAEW